MSRPLQWPHVYTRVNAGGSTTYVVDGGLVVLAGGAKKRQRFYCKNKKAAAAKAQEMRDQRDKLGSVTVQKMALAETELKECMALIQASELGSLKEAVKLAVQAKAGLLAISATPNTTTPTKVAESANTPSKLTEAVIVEYIAARIEAKKGQADTTHEQITQTVLKKALRPYLSKPINVIDVGAVETVLNEGTKTRNTRSRWISSMNGLFKFASHPARSYMSLNPAGAVVRPVSYEVVGPGALVDKEAVKILTAAQLTQLLRLAESEERFHGMIIPIGSQAFLGLRRGETKRLPSFQLSNKLTHYEVLAKRTRSRANREVEVNPTFERWRKRYWKADRPLYPENYSELLRQMCKRLKIAWDRNIIRHSFASHYFVVYGEEATVKQLGHRDSEMLYRHYRKMVSLREGELYWAIEPLPAAPKVSLSLADVTGDTESPIQGKRYGSGN